MQVPLSKYEKSISGIGRKFQNLILMTGALELSWLKFNKTILGSEINILPTSSGRRSKQRRNRRSMIKWLSEAFWELESVQWSTDDANINGVWKNFLNHLYLIVGVDLLEKWLVNWISLTKFKRLKFRELSKSWRVLKKYRERDNKPFW